MVMDLVGYTADNTLRKWRKVRMSNNYWYWKRRRELNAPSTKALPPGHWVTVRQAAKVLGLTPQAVRYRYIRGELPVARVGSRVYVDILGKERQSEKKENDRQYLQEI